MKTMNKVKQVLIMWIASLGLAMASGSDLLPKSMFDEQPAATSPQPAKSTTVEPVSTQKQVATSHYEGVIKKRKALLFRFHSECKYSLVNVEGDEIALVNASQNPFLAQEGNVLPYLNKHVTVLGSAYTIDSAPYLVIIANTINLR